MTNQPTTTTRYLKHTIDEMLESEGIAPEHARIEDATVSEGSLTLTARESPFTTEARLRAELVLRHVYGGGEFVERTQNGLRGALFEEDGEYVIEIEDENGDEVGETTRLSEMELAMLGAAAFMGVPEDE